MLSALAVAAVTASNPFSSNVALLTPSNWTVLEKSPHLWIVNGALSAAAGVGACPPQDAMPLADVCAVGALAVCRQS